MAIRIFCKDILPLPIPTELISLLVLRRTFSGGSSVCSCSASCRLSCGWCREMRQEAGKRCWLFAQQKAQGPVSPAGWLDTQETQEEQRTEKEDPRLLLHRLGGYKTPGFSLFRVPHKRNQPEEPAVVLLLHRDLKDREDWDSALGNLVCLSESAACRESSRDLLAHWSCSKSLTMEVWLPESLLNGHTGKFPQHQLRPA